jgi:hypothetical protein
MDAADEPRDDQHGERVDDTARKKIFDRGRHSSFATIIRGSSGVKSNCELSRKMGKVAPSPTHGPHDHVALDAPTLN